MSNNDVYNDIFVNVFDVKEAMLGDSFSSTLVENWDSLAHLSLISDIEDKFDILIDPEDIIEFNSYEKGKVILSKYGLEI